MTPVRAPSRAAAWLLEAQRSGRGAHARTPVGRASPDRAHGARVRGQGSGPGIDRLEQKDWAFARQLLQRAGELGLLGVDAPEEFGGVGLDKAAALSSAATLAGSASFSAAFGAQGNLAINADSVFRHRIRRRRYLPKLISGELVARTRSANRARDRMRWARRTRASPAGRRLRAERREDVDHQRRLCRCLHRVREIDGEQFTAFIVERGFAGVSTGTKNTRWGCTALPRLRSSCRTRSVPAENVLGEIGKGHKVAFNVLNFGRFKLGAMCVGRRRGASAKARGTPRAQAVRQTDRRVRRHQAQAWRDDACRPTPSRV